MVSPAQWQVYKNIINKAHDSFNQDTVTWRRISAGLQRYGEDNVANETYIDVELKCLIDYNGFRTWPVTIEKATGAVDMESMCMGLNINYLRNEGLLDPQGNFQFDPGKDKFFHMGQEYRAAGETPVAQAGDEPLIIYVILSREKTPTGQNKY
jgi:hypothetical protein